MLTWITATAFAQTVTTDLSAYATGDVAEVSWSGVAAGLETFVALAGVGWPDTQYAYWQAAAFENSGDASFDHLPAGTFEIRVYENNDLIVAARSASFTVTAPSDPNLVVSPSAAPDPSAVVITWTSAPGFYYDWVGVIPAGHPGQDYLAFQYTFGAWDGTMTWADLIWLDPSLATSPGDYDICLFANDAYDVVTCTPLVVCAGNLDGDAVFCDDDDNCPDVANDDQADADGDGLGDACDPPDTVPPEDTDDDPPPATTPEATDDDAVDEDEDEDDDEDEAEAEGACSTGPADPSVAGLIAAVALGLRRRRRTA